MLNLNKHFTNCFSPVYQQIVDSFCVHCAGAEANGSQPQHVLEGTERLIKEELVRCVWFGQHIKKGKLFTDDGSRLEVLSPGWWNSEGGPDFKHAEILLEGKGLVKGDIEVHVFASDWRRHQHDKQETYNAVCLHVVMWNDNDEGYIKNLLGQSIPQLTLSKYLEAELDGLVDMIDVEAYLNGRKVLPGHCQTEMENQRVDELWMGYFLDYAGDERILQKAKRYGKWVKKSPFEQTLYEGIMESMGYKNNKEPFLALASRMPLEDIRSLIPDDVPVKEKAINMQSLFFGLAGLLPEQRDPETTCDDETVAYIKDIKHAWSEISAKINKVPMSKDDWNYAGIRPANFPERRIAALANIISESLSDGIFRRILCVFERLKPASERGAEDEIEGQKIIKSLIEDIQSIFLAVQDTYWSYHYTPGGKKLKKPQKLLGKERTSTLFVNVIIPVFLVYARRHNDLKLEKTLHLVYRNHAPLPATSVTKFMSNRIFTQEKISRKIVNSVRRQQGLYQIFKDFCENDNMSCNKCALYLSMVKSQ